MQEGALEVVRAEGGDRFQWNGYSLSSLFQPIHSVHRDLAVGDEALVRVFDRNGAPVRPRTLLESLERAERVRLDWVCRALHLRSYATEDAGDRRLFLNIHPAALVDDVDGGVAFAQLVRFYGVAPERVVLEVLESDSGDEQALADAVAAHRERGFSIAMDHFGQGRSNFDRIAALRPRIVKMDRSILGRAIGDTQARRTLPAVIGMLKDAGAEVAVKGVDNGRDALAAIEAGAAYLQGFHLGAPARSPRDEVLARELVRSARRLATA